MNILLINPYCLEPRLKEDDIRVPPIGLYYLGAEAMAKGHRCQIANWFDAGGRLEEIERGLKEARPDIIGISILNANRWGGIEIAQAAKGLFPEVPVIFGGPGATFLWHHLLSHFPVVDYVVLGEGEVTFLELISALQEGRDISRIPGIAWRHKGEPRRNEPPDFIEDLDALADPADFFTFQHVISSRGCPWNCTFCGSPSIWKRRVRFHSPDYFVGQLRKLKEKGANFFFVSDDTFTLKRDRVIEICQQIVDQGLDITWQAISRVNHVDQELLTWMRRAGCTQVSYGVESGHPRIRRLLNKDLPEKRIKQAFCQTTAAGMLPRAYFIYGSPTENEKSIKATMKLIDRIRPLAAIFYILDIFPGTALYEEFKERTGATDEIWLKKIEDIMYFETDPRMNRDDILAWGTRLREHFYRRLPRFVDEIELLDEKELYPRHADFLSRLGMTFAFGEYSQVKEIPNKEKIAERLFNRALGYWPDHRAFLGLAIILQKRRRHDLAMEMAQKGLEHFPDSEELNNCLAVSLMNTGMFRQALEILMRFDSSPRALQYALGCAQAMKDMALYQKIAERLERLQDAG